MCTNQIYSYQEDAVFLALNNIYLKTRDWDGMITNLACFKSCCHLAVGDETALLSVPVVCPITNTNTCCCFRRSTTELISIPSNKISCAKRLVVVFLHFNAFQFTPTGSSWAWSAPVERTYPIG